MPPASTVGKSLKGKDEKRAQVFARALQLHNVGHGEVTPSPAASTRKRHSSSSSGVGGGDFEFESPRKRFFLAKAETEKQTVLNLKTTQLTTKLTALETAINSPVFQFLASPKKEELLAKYASMLTEM